MIQSNRLGSCFSLHSIFKYEHIENVSLSSVPPFCLGRGGAPFWIIGGLIDYSLELGPRNYNRSSHKVIFFHCYRYVLGISIHCKRGKRLEWYTPTQLITRAWLCDLGLNFFALASSVSQLSVDALDSILEDSLPQSTKVCAKPIHT